MSCRGHCHCPPPAPKDPPDTSWLDELDPPATAPWGATEWLVTYLIGAAVVVGMVLLGGWPS